MNFRSEVSTDIMEQSNNTQKIKVQKTLSHAFSFERAYGMSNRLSRENV